MSQNSDDYCREDAGHSVKYVFVTGGTLAGIGKKSLINGMGIVLEALGFSVSVIKMDTYLNVGKQAVNPMQYAEDYMLTDGETDVDLGCYEKFLYVNLMEKHHLTTGKIFVRVIGSERRGDYLGKTVQIVPHVTGAIQEWIEEAAQIPVNISSTAMKNDVPHADSQECVSQRLPDVCLIEVGGIVGDIESSFHFEALKQFSVRVGDANFCLCHVTWVPSIAYHGNEFRLEPTLDSLKELHKSGLKPDMLFLRTQTTVTAELRHRVSLLSGISADKVFGLELMKNVHSLPLIIYRQGFGVKACQKLKLRARYNEVCSIAGDEQLPFHLAKWKVFSDRMGIYDVETSDSSTACSTTVAIVGDTSDEKAYSAIRDALMFAATESNLQIEFKYIDAKDFEFATEISHATRFNRAWHILRNVAAVVLPDGCGDNGVNGKILVCRFCRETNKPFLGVCLGMQIAVIDACRDLLNIEDATSEEFVPDAKNKVVCSMNEVDASGSISTVSLGRRKTIISKRRDSLIYQLYDQHCFICQRHRHRFEVNPDYFDKLESVGMRIVGKDESGMKAEIIELENHPFFVGVQFHPEFISRPLHPNPLFLGLILASVNTLEERFSKYDQRLCPGEPYSSAFANSLRSSNDHFFNFQVKNNGPNLDLSQSGAFSKKPLKYIVVTGGTISGLGKGTVISSIGFVLKSLGFRVTAIKIDPYLNIDAGTMSPYEHGEVYVLRDGGEVDVDLGNYERFIDITLSKDHNLTTGKIFDLVIRRQELGAFGNRKVQIDPDVTNCIQEWIERVAQYPVDSERHNLNRLHDCNDLLDSHLDNDLKISPPSHGTSSTTTTVGSSLSLNANTELNANDRSSKVSSDFNILQSTTCSACISESVTSANRDTTQLCTHMDGSRPEICLIEVGGTVGDLESESYLQAIQQFSSRLGSEHICLCHVTWIPEIGSLGEQKTKPTQHSIKILRRIGLNPDFIFCRTSSPIAHRVKKKINKLEGIPVDNIVGIHNVRHLYMVPNVIVSQGFHQRICARLGVTPRFEIQHSILFNKWSSMVKSIEQVTRVVKIGIVGKYTDQQDTYSSVSKALQHAANALNLHLEVVFIESVDFESQDNDAWHTLYNVDGVICPGGFGDRGVQGKIIVSKFCRENKKPFLGICLGMQIAVIDICRDLLNIKDATSEEFVPDAKNKVIIYMPDYSSINMGGTMRLGEKITLINSTDSLAYRLYGRSKVFERHRHRYEVNPEFIKLIESAGVRIIGKDETGKRAEIIELTDHPFFIGVQYHPEFTSRPLHPNPLFSGLIQSSDKSTKSATNCDTRKDVEEKDANCQLFWSFKGQ